MKKALGLVCGLTILSSCSSLFGEEEKVTAPHHAPVLNTSGNIPPSIPMMSPTPPALPQEFAMNSARGNDYMPMPPAAPVVQMPAANPALPNDRRPPEFNRQAMGIAAPVTSGDLLPTTATPQVAQGPIVVPPAPPAVVQGAKIPSPPANLPPSAPTAPVLPQRANDYPKLADIPPSPPAPMPAQSDPRVQQMKTDLASMNEQSAEYAAAKPRVIVKSVSNGSMSAPVVQTAVPSKLAPNKTIETSEVGSLSVPKDFSLPKPGSAPVIPEPPAVIPTTPTVVAAAPAPVKMAALTPPPANGAVASMQTMPAPVVTPSAGIMPNGPTIIVRSANARPMVPAPVQMAAAPAPAPGFVPMPAPVPATTPVAAAKPATAPMPRQLAPVPPAFADVPAAAPVTPVASTHLGGSTTSLSSLHPIPVTPVGGSQPAYASASTEQSGGYTSPNDLKPIASTSQYRLLPESRYANYRRSTRDDGAY